MNPPRYTVVVCDSATDYGHEHEHTNRRAALADARAHKGSLYLRSGGRIRVEDHVAGQVIWHWHEHIEGGYFQATLQHPYPIAPGL
jgi:hypothetical protein